MSAYGDVVPPLRVGGVPEHFNLPWRLTLESGRVEQLGVEVHWREFAGGSGPMAAALSGGRLDVAMLLTEGAVAGIAAGGGFSIVSCYTSTPLVWGIHVPAQSRFRTLADIESARYAISRMGSGSHLISFVHAEQQGWATDSLRLVAVGDLQGAIDAFDAGRADVFFWEKFMTKPLVDAGRFRRVGEFTAPWPAFVVCVARPALESRAAAIARLLAAVFETAAGLAARTDAAELIAGRYGLEPADVAEWLTLTRWAGRVGVPSGTIEPVVGALGRLGLIADTFDGRGAVAELPAN